MAGWDFLDTLDSPQPKEVDGNWSFLDTLDSPQKPIARQPSGESFQDVSNRSLLDEFALGINRGTEQLKSSLYGFGGIVGSIIGNESLKQAGFKGFQEHEAEAAKYPKAVNLKDVTLGTFPSLLVGTIGEVVPSMVEAAATTLAGTILGAATGTAVAPVGGTAVGAAGGAATGLAGIFARQAGRNLMKEAAESFVKKGIARETAEVMAKEEVKKIATNELVKMGARAAGSKAGMFAGVLPMESGGNWGEALKEYGIDNPWSALATGTMASFLEFAGGNSRVIRDVLGTAEESAFRKAIASADTHAIVRIAKKAITQGGEEAAQEMGQEFLSLANIAVNDPKFEMFTKDNMWRILESGFGGLVAGAGGGVVSGIVSPKPGGKTDLTAPPDETKEQAKIILNDSERKEILKYAEDKLDELNKKDIAGTITADERAEFNFLKENSTSPEAIVSQYQPKAQPSISIDVLKGVGFTKEQIDKMDLPTISSTLQVVSKQITERAKPNADVIYDAVVDGKRGIEWHTRGGKSGFVEMGGSEQITRDSAQKAFQEAVQKEKEEAALMSKASPEEKQAYQVKSVLDRILAYFNRNAPIDPSGKEQHAKLMKGKGFQFSALRRRATGNPTDSDLKSAFKHLDSNYVGKRVRLNDGREAVVVSGKGKNVTVIFSDGIQKDVSRGNIVTPKATKAEAIEYLKQKGLDEVDQLINTYKDLFPEVFEQTKEQRKVKRITGLSPELSQLLVDNGITSEQAASLPPENVKAILGYLSTKKTTVPDDRKSMFNYVEKLFNGILGFNFEFNYFDFNLKDPIDVTTPEGVARLKELGHTLEGVLKALGVTYEQLKSKGGRISIAIQGRHHTVQGVDNRRTQSCWVFKGSDPTTVIHEALHGYWRERGFQGWNADEETVNLWLEKQFNGREFKDKAEFEDWLEQKRNEFNAAQPKTKEGVSAGTRYKTGEASRAPPGFKSLQERAAETFGHTEFFEEAGFINNDGNLLDFSGRSLPPEQRHPGGYRALEHRYISWITGEEHPIASIWKYLLTGAIRVDGKMGAIELGERPTLEQIDKIYTLAEKFNGNIVVDLHEWKNVPKKPDYGFLLNNDRLWGDQYDKGTSPQKIISDINKFYDGGTPVVKHINYKVGELSLDERLKGVPEKFKDKPVTLTHWSHKRGLRTLNPKYFGTGFAGQERDRFGKSYVPQMYYGVKGYTKEHGLGKETYKGLVEGNDLYNRDYDPLNLMPTPKDLTRRGFAPFDQNEKHNLYDRRIKEAGYKGMYSETYDVVCMFTPVEVEQVKPRQTAYKTGEIMPGFYSQLITVVDKHLKEMPSKIQSIIGYLERKQVKPAELKWMAVEQWLKENEVNGVIDKQKFLQFLKDNQIEIQEVTKGAGEWKGDEYFVNGNREANVGYSDGEGWYFESDTSEATEIFETKAEAMKAAEEDVIGLYGKAETKFAQYQLSGGENYRELLLTLPIQHETLKYDLKNVNPILPGEYEATNPDMFWYFRAPDQVYQIPKSRYPNEGEAREYVIQRKTPAVEADYKSSHWDEPNVLAHIRFNERTDAEGNKVLFIEEVQSDWHQEGKKKGYAVSGEVDKELARWVAQDRSGNIDDEWYQSTLDKLQDKYNLATDDAGDLGEQLNNILRKQKEGVPPAPFAENWHELVMKRMLRYAAENGYDKIAWTTGEQQAERYNLSKHISEVHYNETRQGLTAYDLNKEPVIVRSNVKPEDVENYIGKEAAKRLFDNPETSTVKGAENMKMFRLEGADLKVGGEGMKSFYDQLIPGFMNRYVKQWGAKVGESKIDTTTQRGDAWVVYQDGEIYDGFRTEKQAKDFIGQFGKEDQNRFEIKYEGDTARASTVPSVDITPSMKKDVLEKGQPVYKTGNPRDIGTYILTGETKPKRFTKVSEIAKYLTEQGAKAGIIDWQTATGRQNKTVENSLRKFYEICSKRFPESLEWYKQDIETTFNTLEEIYPELKERGNRGMMTLALAITSNGNETTKNVELAANVYENYKAKKRFSMTLDATRKETIDTHLALARKLRKNFNSDEEFIDWLLEVKTAKEIKNEVSKILGISAEEAHVIISNTSDDFRIPRAAMFGSKIGSFFANMNGDYSHLTTDMWFMRTVGRITGDLSTVDEDIFNQKQEEFIQSVENAPKAGRLISWQKSLFGEDIEPYVLSLERRFSNENFRDTVNALEGGEELRKVTNSFAKYIKGNLKESPSSGNHRQWLYDRIKNITKPGEDMASVQAAMWIGEKEVYRELGAKQKKGDYFSKGASVLWEKHFGRPLGGIARGTGRTGRNIRSAFTKNIESEGRGIETKLFKKIYDVVMSRPDGFTIEVSNGENQTKGWVVSPAKETELRLDKFTRQDAIDYLNKFKKVFESDPRAFFGGWFDTQTNKFVLDISFIVEDKETALYLAEIGNQDAVFHLDDLGTDINPEVRREDGIKELRQSGVYSESKRDSLRGVRESLLTEIRRARVDTTQSSLFKTGEITLEEVEDESQKIVLEQAKRAATPKKEFVFTPKKNIPLTVQRNIPPEFQDVVYETIANDEEIAKADSIMTSKEAVIRYATNPELVPAGIRKTAAMVSAINFAQKLNDPELFMILGGKDSFLKYSSYVAQELQLLRELYKDSPAIAIREINIVRETEAVKKDSNIKQRAKEQTNVGKQTVKADVNRSINKEATRRLIDLIKC